MKANLGVTLDLDVAQDIKCRQKQGFIFSVWVNEQYKLHMQKFPVKKEDEMIDDKIQNNSQNSTR